MKRKKNPSQEQLAFHRHKKGAENGRGIEFHFTYDEWVAWWKYHLGDDWLAKRGCHMGQYCMARYGDTGPYAPWNVKCITHSANSREQTKKVRSRKLTDEQIKDIYLTRGQRSLAKKYGIALCTVKSIKRKKTWSSVTDLLD